MHAVCGFPVKSMRIKAIKAGNYVGWPMLTERNVNKYYLETNETPTGHMAQARKNVRSTRPKPMKEYKAHHLKGKKRGNKYIMVMVEIDSSVIVVEPMKSRKDEEIIRAYMEAGITVKKHVLDNEKSHHRRVQSQTRKGTYVQSKYFQSRAK